MSARAPAGAAARGVPYPLGGKRVWVAGHRGMVGAALMRRLAREGCELLTAGREALDLTCQDAVERWMAANRPQAVFLAAAEVGGILANLARPAAFLRDNLMIAANVVDAARATGAEKLLFLGSSCIYPRDAPQPIGEGALLSGPLEPSNRAYAVAKIAGLELCRAYRRQYGCDFIAAMPANLYGPGDNFDLETGHVLPALVRKAHEAKASGSGRLVVWGSGRPRREFLHVDDCADALVLLVQRYSDAEAVNVGCGEDLTIAELARLVAEVVGFDGEIVFDPGKPDGTPRKLLAVSKLAALGWRPQIALRRGIADAYRAFLGESAAGRL